MIASRAPVEPGARPDLTPGVAGDQILEGGRVPRRSSDRGVDVLVAEDLAADPHPFAVPIVHATSSIDVARCSVTRLENVGRLDVPEMCGTRQNHESRVRDPVGDEPAVVGGRGRVLGAGDHERRSFDLGDPVTEVPGPLASQQPA